MRRALIVAALLAGCESQQVKCNRAKVAAHDAWAALEKSIDDEVGIPAWLRGPKGQELKQDEAAKRRELLLHMVGDNAADAKTAASGRAIPAREAAKLVSSVRLVEASFTHPLLVPAETAADLAWETCKDVEP